jgi:glutamyl-Q tRNA(Asp) synthetase
MRVFRFAPSPNGFLHLGHALSALINDAMARKSGGRLLLRIEDIDATRCRPEFEAAILGDLAWIGVDVERPVRRQSEHMADYHAALSRLEQAGLVYRSYESRSEIARFVESADAIEPWPRDPDGAPIYRGPMLDPGEVARRAATDAPYATRLDIAKAAASVGPLTFKAVAADDIETIRTVKATPEDWGDVVLARKEVPTSYHLSVVVDDALQGITHVVRGADLLAATSLHRLLQTLLGLPEPAYHHHRLILDADGHKLSKSTGATGLRALRAAGVTPAEVRRRLS